ncbi:TetR family transcriptional regulator [Kitasatospora herbaricolor]|uniref:TetR family transcriptional regulator n=1 Tax=Kitasatospora indigofera TaxID=67307 RepID=A0A919G8Q9_9ACTN|nr:MULTISPECIES: TetR family transcriptional regulator [Kitasatospora]MDQ0308981.1 AcrR family transcriptional regulator [Kitasatospora herbaricolor]GGV02305.1 TetR family transcriptional regulator [Kitasatospora herbaricolor]GHH80138.1 TetR family transcriptional regulator [Kitasatospora indigofera]
MTGQVRTVDGRVAGRRGQETRQKLLDCLREMLSTSPYRDVKVIDVARMAGTSPATFYQYFPDVEGAVLEIAEEMAKDSDGLKELVAGKSWAGKSGVATSEELVDGFLAFWRKNDAILRVVTLGAAEGDKRFFKIRMTVLNSVAKPLTDAVKDLQSKGQADKTLDPAAVSGALISLLASAAEHGKAFTAWGVKVKDLKPNLAPLVYLGVTGKKPPK